MHVSRALLSAAGICLGCAVFATESASAAHRQPPPAAAPAIFVGAQRIPGLAYIDRRRVFVPLRGVFEAIDASVSYAPPHFVVVRKAGAVIAGFVLDRPRAIIGQRAVDLDDPPTRRNGRVYVPLRVIAEAAGATVAYSGRPPIVHIRPHDPSAPAAIAPVGATANSPISDLALSSTSQWRLGVAVVTTLCCLGCLALTARRFVPPLLRSAALGRTAARVPAAPVPIDVPLAESVALSSVEASGEARFYKEVVTETRTIEVPVAREELVIEYAGDGGSVIIEGRPLAAGETVRIPLWEERVQIDVTKHVVLKEDIVIDKRRVSNSAPLSDGARTEDLASAEGNPS